MEYYALKDIIIILKRHEFGGFFLKEKVEYKWNGKAEIFMITLHWGKKAMALFLKGNECTINWAYV